MGKLTLESVGIRFQIGGSEFIFTSIQVPTISSKEVVNAHESLEKFEYDGLDQGFVGHGIHISENEVKGVVGSLVLL